MRLLVGFLALLLAVVAVALVAVNYFQVETIALLREQNALLWAQVSVGQWLNNRQGALAVACDHLVGNMTSWLGIDPLEALGGP